jgi:two-component system chemotaxis response regulator CheB
MASRIIVIGASAGGVSAVRQVLSDLKPDLPAAVFVAMHRSASLPSFLESVLGKSSALPLIEASDGPIRQGAIYVAPPDHHLILERGKIKVTRDPKENLYRPSIDVLFRSAAFAYRSAVIGVVMTGLLDDGTAGLFYIKRYGGATIVQDPRDAEFKGMPESALSNVKIDHVAPLAEIAPLLTELVSQPLKYRRRPISFSSVRHGHDMSNPNGKENGGAPSSFTCPECHGPIFISQNGSLTEYRCLVGHAYGPSSMVQAQYEGLERMLWSAANFLKQKANLEERSAEAARQAGNQKEARRFKRCAVKSRRQADTVETILGDLDSDA